MRQIPDPFLVGNLPAKKFEIEKETAETQRRGEFFSGAVALHHYPVHLIHIVSNLLP
jgi:hypothetical protein